MRALLTNFGTMGDLQPLLALGVELRRHGHEVTVAFSPQFEARVRSYGFPFVPLGPNLQAAQNRANQGLDHASHDVGQLEQLMMPLIEALPQAYLELLAASEGQDVLVCGPALPAGRMVHESTGIPFVSLQFSHFGGVGSPALQRSSATLINPIRAKYGLPPLENPLTLDANSPQLALYAMSRHVRPPQHNWAAHYYMTGPFFLDDDVWQPDERLLKFLAAGAPPVVFTFGSMTHGDPHAITTILLETIAAVGCRAIIQQGWSGLGGTILPDTVLGIEYVSHHWLFPRAACIVHHGGAGTASAVFRSGVQGIIVPHGVLFDQTYWAQLAEELGVGGATVPFAELSTARLTASLRTVLTTPSYSTAAAALGQKIRSEPGVVQARQLIEALVRRVKVPDDEMELEEVQSARSQQRRAFQNQARRRRDGA